VKHNAVRPIGIRALITATSPSTAPPSCFGVWSGSVSAVPSADTAPGLNSWGRAMAPERGTAPREQLMSDHPIILFDGVCTLCNGWVQFIIKRDSPALFRFATLQSQTGQRLLAQYGLSLRSMETMVLIDGGSAFTKSDAALRIARYLPGVWPLFDILCIVPRFLRNRAYDLVARNRYRWFGKHDVCMVPTGDMRHRFLE
jgi:predicted DCC family thiol-disulfide oxidoreductase YuxK